MPGIFPISMSFVGGIRLNRWGSRVPEDFRCGFERDLGFVSFWRRVVLESVQVFGMDSSRTENYAN